MFVFDTWLSPLTWLVDLVLNVSIASSCLGKGFCVKSFIMKIIPWWKTSRFIRTNVTLKGFFLLYCPSQDVFWSNKRRGQKVLLMVSWFLAFDAHFKPSMISDEKRSLKGIRNSLNYSAPGEQPLNYANIFSLRKSRFTTFLNKTCITTRQAGDGIIKWTLPPCVHLISSLSTGNTGNVIQRNRIEQSLS